MTLNAPMLRRRLVLMPLLLMLIAAIALADVATTSAQTMSSCQDQFTKLRAGTQSVAITGGKVEKERTGLMKLVDDAQNLASTGRTSDAVTKLNNFTVKVDQLESAGRISAGDAALLRSDAQAAVACLQGSSTA